MRIALAGDWFLPRMGGIELQVRDLGLQLQARGHEVEIVTPVPGPSEVDGMTVHRLRAPRLPGAGIVFTPAAFHAIRNVLAAGRYDAVHVHFGIIAPAAYGMTMIAQSLGIPTVATFHSVLRHFDIPLAAVRALLGVGGWKVEWSAVSSIVARHMRPLVGATPVRVVPNGIDAAFWSGGGAVRRQAPGVLRAVSVMRLHRRKRPGALVAAVQRANRALPDGRRIELTVIGDGAERRHLERSLGPADGGSIRFTGWQSRDAVRAALQAADVFVMPSTLEAFGIAALEARCAGLPVVAMSSGGAADYLTPEVDSLLVDDDGAFAEALLSLATDEGLLERLSRGSSGAPPAGCDWPSVVAAQEAAYRSAAARVTQLPTRLSSAGNAGTGMAVPLAGIGRPIE